MKDEHQIVIFDPSGKQHMLPIDLQRLQGLRLIKRESSEDLKGSEDLDVWVIQMRELAALDPEKFVIMACQLYASQRDLQQPPSRADGSVSGKDVAEWFKRVVSHVEEAPIGDPWADFVSGVINETPEMPAAG